MLFWRKALAIITLMVFLPATVLAAMPVKLCLGADGHRAIESMIGGGHHDTAPHHDDFADAATESLEAPSDCIDRSILTAASSALRNSSDPSEFSALENMPPVVLGDAIDQLATPAIPIDCSSRSAQVIEIDPFLVAHATDVLLN